MPFFRGRPRVVEAIQWTGYNFHEVGTFCPFAIGPIVRMEPTDLLGSCNRIRIDSPYGEQWADENDWIVKYANSGQLHDGPDAYYVYKPHEFHNTFYQDV